MIMIENDANLMQPGRAFVPMGSNVEQHRQGGEGSGNFGHAGRPGEVGGSGAGGVTTSASGEKKGESAGSATYSSPESSSGSPKGKGDYATRYSEVGIKPEELGDYEREVEDVLSRAKSTGILAHEDSRAAERHASEAASAINTGKGGTGGTVYGSHISTPDQRNLPMVAYGAGTTKTQIGRIGQQLRDANFNVVHYPEAQGFLVSSKYAKPDFW